MSSVLNVSARPGPSHPLDRSPTACSIVLRADWITFLSSSGLDVEDNSWLFVIPCPINSQCLFFISSTALGNTSHTDEFKATVARTPAESKTSAILHRPTLIPYSLQA